MMRPLALLLALALPALSQTPAPPEKHPIDVALERAIAQNSSTAGMVEAFATASKAWDGELNKNYGILMARLDPDAKNALRESQRAWIAHRDKEIDFLLQFYGKLRGTMYRTIYAETTMSIVRRRAVKLGHLVQMLDLRDNE